MTHDAPDAHEGHEHLSDDELRARLEDELRRITVQDVLLQTVVSLVNLGGQRLGATPDTEDMRDLDQVRIAIEGVRALLPVLEERDAEQVRPVRDALSQLQLAYARLAGEAGAAPQPSTDKPPPRPAGRQEKPRDTGGLWVPPGSTG